MIRHIVFFSAKRREDIPAMMRDLMMLGEIPHSACFEVVENSRVDQLGNAIDVVVYSEFADEAALAAYKAHPKYDMTTNLVRPMRELRFAADIVSGG